MNNKTRKTLWRAAIYIVSAATAVIAIIALAVNLVLTNERLSPIIKKYAHEYLDADVKIGDANGAFFSTFPYIGVRLDSVSIVTNAFHGGPSALSDSLVVADTLRTRRDTLARIKSVIVGLNLMEYLLSDSDKLTIGLIRLEEPRIRLLTDSMGRNSWDMMRPSDTSESDTTGSMDITIRHIDIKDGRIAYFSRPDQMGVLLDSINLNVDGETGVDKLDADIALDMKRTSLGIKATRYLRKMPLGLNGHMVYETETGKILLNGLCLRIATADIDLDGWVHPDDTGATMDIQYRLDTPSAEKLFAAIPKSVISSPVDIKDGAIAMHGRVTGRTSETEIPIIKGEARLDKIHAQYAGRPDEIEDITARFNMLVDQARPDSSYVNLDIFHFKGGKSEVSAIVKVSQLLTDAMMDSKVKAHVDFSNLQRVIPFDNTKMSGVMDADVTAHFSIKDIMRKNYGNARLDGLVTVDKICITNDTTGFELDIDADLKMKSDNGIWLTSNLDRLEIKAGRMTLKAKHGGFEAQSAFAKDTTHVVPLTGKVHVSRLFFKSDTIAVFAKNIHTDDRILPEEADPRKPTVHHVLNVDTIFAGIMGNRIFSHGIRVEANQRVENDTAWHTSGNLEYAHLGAMSTFFRKPIKTHNFRLTMDGDSVNVNHVEISTGHTSARAKGYVSNLFSSIKNRRQVTLNLGIDADTIDCNEILANIINEKPDSVTAQAENMTMGLDTTQTAMTYAADTLRADTAMIKYPAMILVPKHIRLSVSARAKCIKWSTLGMSDVVSEIRTKEGAAHVTNLSFKIGDARSISIMSYKAWPHSGKARANIFSRWERADIGLLSSALGLDTIIPALKPIKGKLDCYMAAEIELDSLMNVILPTARASIHLGGQKLTLMDNDSFKKIGKKLMFKDKNRNVIDTLSMNVLLDSGRIQVLPFVVNIDRYRMACAGTQDLDMNMKYHISILKSPLPFKAGVNITGTPEDFDVDITTAKLKKLVDGASMVQNDSLSLKMRMSVLRNSYILSGQPMPAYIRQMKGLQDNPRFSIAIQEDSDTEESLREAEMARRAAAEIDTTSAVKTDSIRMAQSQENQ